MSESATPAHRRAVRAWCLYDWANSAFATTIMAVVLPTFYSSVAASDLPPARATSYWGYTNSIAMLMVAFAAPVLGAIADHTGSKKRMLGFFASVGVLATALLYLVSTGDWLLASFLYVFGRIGFSGSNVFYDALLPHVAKPDEIDQVSAQGYAWGYVGGGILLAVNLAWILYPSTFGFADGEMATRIAFVSVALWWGLFSIPLFRRVSEPAAPSQPSGSKHYLRIAFNRLRYTFQHVRQYGELLKFLIAYWFYNDGIGTIITMAAIYGAELGISNEHLIGAILMVQFVAAPFAFLFGWLAKRFGTKNSILLGLVIYACIAVAGYFVTSTLHFWVLAFAVATVQGGSQALSRSLFGAMSPNSRSAEFFGFYDISSKFSGIVGPAIFGFVGAAMGSSRYAILALVTLFIIGGFLLYRVDDQHGIAVAAAEDEAARAVT
ncbi:MAG: MFS transporter [Anaerolineae bacterium]